MVDIADYKAPLLKKQACFTKLTDEEIHALSALLIDKHIKAGETIVREGDHVDSVYLIVKGTADVRHVLIKNNAESVQSVFRLGPGDAIGLNEYGFYSLSGVRTATVVALTDMTLLRLSVAAFHGFALSNAHVSEIMRENKKKFTNTQQG